MKFRQRRGPKWFQSYLSPKTFEWLNSLPKEIKLDYKCLIDSFLAKYKLDGEEILTNFSQEPDLEIYISKFEKMAQLDMPPNVLKKFFIANLNPKYKQAFCSFIPDSLEDCIRIARRQKIFKTEIDMAENKNNDNLKNILFLNFIIFLLGR